MRIRIPAVAVACMLVIVLGAQFGPQWIPSQRLARRSHVLAGATNALSGGVIRLYGR